MLCSVRWWGRLASLIALLVGTTVHAQDATRLVEGRVVLPTTPIVLDTSSESPSDTTAVRPVPNVWVVLHRVAPELAGPLDSIRTDAAGAYRFRFTPSGGDQAVYFVSASYGGIAYFSNPLKEPETRGDDAQIAVFDTTSRAFPLTVRGRHLIVSAPDSTAHRTLVEVFEVSNDSTLTIVAPESADAQPTWTFSVPREAIDLQAGQGDLPADAFVQSIGKVSLYSALAPGLKQVSVSYRLPASAFPLDLRIGDGAVVLEVLMEEPDAHVHGADLAAVPAVTLEGRQFQRFLAQDVQPGTVIYLEPPSGGIAGRTLYVAVLVAAVALLVLLSVLRAGINRQRPLADTGPGRPGRPAASDVATPDRLAREIADLDAAFARQGNPSESVRTAYERRRAELAAVLREALAANGSVV